MKKWLAYLIVIGAVAFLGGKGAGKDIGKLQPVQTVVVSAQNGQVQIQTDTGDLGLGQTVADAIENMEGTSAYEIFLDTADYLLIEPGCASLLSELTAHLRPSCTICLTDGGPDLETVGKFLQRHEPEVTLQHYRAGRRDLPMLRTREGRMELVR